MAQELEADDWSNIRVRTVLVKRIKEFIKRNPVFENPSQVVDFAVNKLFKEKYDL